MSHWVWTATPSGPLAPHAAGYEQWLREVQGFGRDALNVRLWQFRHLSLWLEREGFSAEELTPECGDRYVVERRAAGYSSYVSRLSLRLPLSYLREAGVAPPPAPADGPVERLLGDYRRYLVRERGLATQERLHGVDDQQRVGVSLCSARAFACNALNAVAVVWSRVAWSVN